MLINFFTSAISEHYLPLPLALARQDGFTVRVFRCRPERLKLNPSGNYEDCEIPEEIKAFPWNNIVGADLHNAINIFSGFHFDKRIRYLLSESMGIGSAATLIYDERPFNLKHPIYDKFLVPLLLKYYSLRFNKIYSKLDGILAIGDQAVNYYSKVNGNILPSAYFLKSVNYGPVASVGATSPSIILAGRLIDVKGVYDVAKVINRISGEFVVHIYGEGPLASNIRALCNADSRFVYMGATDMNQFRSRLVEYDVAVAYSKSADGWNVFATEAFTAGCLLIVSQHIGCLSSLNSSDVLVAYSRTDLKIKLQQALKTVLTRPVRSIKHSFLNDRLASHINFLNNIYEDLESRADSVR